MNLLKRHWLIASLVVVGIAVFAAFRFKGSEQPKYFTAKVDRGNISQVVEATGTTNAVTTVQVGSQVSGTISRLNADFNSRVKKGQVVAQIDPSLFEGSLLQAKADLANAKANVGCIPGQSGKSAGQRPASPGRLRADCRPGQRRRAENVHCRARGLLYPRQAKPDCRVPSSQLSCNRSRAPRKQFRL